MKKVINNGVRNLNIGAAIEVLNGRMNGSASDVENSVGRNKNTTYVKKIGNRGMMSGVCTKYNMKKFSNEVDGLEMSTKNFLKADGDKKSRIVAEINPFKYFNDDLYGGMNADKKTELSPEEYELLDEKMKTLYKKKGTSKKTVYEKIGSGTKKRKTNVQVSPFINMSNNKINKEFCTSGASDGNTIIDIETFAGVMYSIMNINIAKIGKYTISDEDIEFRDYSEAEAEASGVKNLDNNQKFVRINSLLRSIEYLAIEGNQTNYLTDTKPKFIILGEYSWGNNVFQGLINKDGLDVEMLEEAIEQNEEFRISPIWIGVNRFNEDGYNEKMKEKLDGLAAKYDFINISNVHAAFTDYKKFLANSLDVIAE